VKTRVAVLASGGGSNLGALFEHLDSLGARARAEVVLVASNVASAGALDRARSRGVAAEAVERPADLGALLERSDAEIVVLAGYLRLVPFDVVRAYRGRMLNVHPALLPAFGGPGMYGARVHQAVLDAGARVSGATVHFVDEEYDRGAIIAQWPVPVFEEDTADDLARRVLRVEHALLPRVVNALAAEAIALDDDGRVRGAFLVGQQGAAFTLPRADTDLDQEMDAAMA
jgi:formyltetrahydrofolate-dependent phosphoribosylglycinamide formyltransferase